MSLVVLIAARCDSLLPYGGGFELFALAANSAILSLFQRFGRAEIHAFAVDDDALAF